MIFANLQLVCIFVLSVGITGADVPDTTEKFIGGWIPIGPTPSPTPAPTPAPSTMPPTTPADDVALNTINTFRASHVDTLPVTYNQTLKDLAQACADQHAADGSISNVCDVGGTCGETTALNPNSQAANGLRGCISDTVSGSWFSQWNAAVASGAINPNRPVYKPECAGYTQMIWQATTQVGCGYSTQTFNDPGTGLAQHVCSCVWCVAGNTPTTFPTNVRPPIFP